MIPHSRCSRTDKTDLKDLSARAFKQKKTCFDILRVPKIIFPENGYGVSWIAPSNLLYPKSGIMVSGGSWTFSLVPQIIKMKLFRNFGKVIVKSYLSNMKQNNPTELLAFPRV